MEGGEEWKAVNIVAGKYKGNPFTGNQLSVEIRRIRKGFLAQLYQELCHIQTKTKKRNFFNAHCQ